MTTKEEATALITEYRDILGSLPPIPEQDGVVRLSGSELEAIERRVLAAGVLVAYADKKVNLGPSDPANIQACAEIIGQFVVTHNPDL